jgi:DNA-binding XRE family transcriptional regulator
MEKQTSLKVNPQFVGMSFEDYEKNYVGKEKQREYELKAQLIVNLIAERKKANMSQKKLEELSGVRQPTIARIERGSMNPSLDIILRLLAAMGKTLKIASL